jgi:hypothetical protein
MSVVLDRGLIGSGHRTALCGSSVGCWGLLIRSGDDDLFGQTAARPSTRIRFGPCRRAAEDLRDRRLIIAAASRRQRHDFTERGPRALGKTVGAVGRWGLQTTGAMAGR